MKTEKIYLGRIDPETGEIIPKATGGRRNRTPIGAQAENDSNPAPDLASEDVLARIGELEGRIRQLESEVAHLRSEAEAREGLVRDIVEAIEAYRCAGDE